MNFVNFENVKKIDEYIEKNRNEITNTLFDLVRIPSVKSLKAENAPFGKECKDALIFTEKLYKDNGFETKMNFKDGYALAFCGNKTGKSIGVFAHTDVVPAGEGWIYTKPFEPIIYKDHYIARGVNDNKNGVVQSLYAAKIIKELGFELKNELVFFSGSNEESGMVDIKAFANNEEMPTFSVVPDGEPPCNTGEKSIINFKLINKKPFEDIIVFKGGKAYNIILEETVCRIKSNDKLYDEIVKVAEEDSRYKVSREEGYIEIVAKGITKHAAYPEGSVNAAYLMCKLLSECEHISCNDKEILSECKNYLGGYYGESFGIEYENEPFGKLTAANGIVGMTDENKMYFTVDIRAPHTCDLEECERKIMSQVEKNWDINDYTSSKGYYIPEDSVLLKTVLDTYNYFSKSDEKGSYCSGGTYARYLKNALPISANAGYAMKEIDFPGGHGSAHQPDEKISIDGFMEAIKVLVCTILELDSVI